MPAMSTLIRFVARVCVFSCVFYSIAESINKTQSPKIPLSPLAVKARVQLIKTYQVKRENIGARDCDRILKKLKIKNRCRHLCLFLRKKPESVETAIHTYICASLFIIVEDHNTVFLKYTLEVSNKRRERGKK